MTSPGKPPTTSPPEGPGVIGELSTRVRQSAGFLTSGQPTAQLVAVRQASQDGFQRVVLMFQDQPFCRSMPNLRHVPT
jgi:hypothetical protein